VSRTDQALGEPPADLTAFPGVEVGTDVDLFRAHTAGREPWWFASVPELVGTTAGAGGRFDLADPRGTCYLATDPSTAVRERLAASLLGVAVVGPDVPAAMAVSQVRLPSVARLANTADEAAEGPLTREVTSTGDYALTRRWAAAWDRDGFDGVRYETRFTMRPKPTAIALFGERGLGAGPVVGSLDPVGVLADMGISVASGYRPSHHVVPPPAP